MNKLISRPKDDKPSRKVQENQTIALIVLGVAVLVMSCIIAVLLAQVEGHRRSIDSLFHLTTGLPTSEQ